jgi:hypothetical protein
MSLKSDRTLALGVIAVTLAYSSWLAAGPTPAATSGVLDTRGVLVRDAKGNIRASLTVSDDGSPVMTLMDDAKRTRVEISVRNGASPCVKLLDDREQPRLALKVDDVNGASVAVFGSRRNMVFELGTWPDDTIQQSFFTRLGQRRIRSIVLPSGASESSLLGVAEQPGIWMGVSENGDARQSFFDREGNEHITLNVEPAGDSLHFLSRDRKSRMIASVAADGTALNVLYDKNGRRRVGTYVDARGLARQMLFGPSGNPALSLSSDQDAIAGLKFYDVQGTPQFGASVDLAGDASFFWRRQERANGRVYIARSNDTGAGRAIPEGQPIQGVSPAHPGD